MSDRWAVLLDGKYYKRNLTHAQAFQHADFMQRGLDRHKASDKRRTGELVIRPDTEMNDRLDRTYRTMKSHTMVSRP